MITFLRDLLTVISKLAPHPEGHVLSLAGADVACAAVANIYCAINIGNAQPRLADDKKLDVVAEKAALLKIVTACRELTRRSAAKGKLK